MICEKLTLNTSMSKILTNLITRENRNLRNENKNKQHDNKLGKLKRLKSKIIESKQRSKNFWNSKKEKNKRNKIISWS